MKKIYFLCFALLLLGCVEYEGDVRLVIEGKVTDNNGNPLSEISVLTKVYQEDVTDNIGIAKTDKQGNFKMFFPKPTINPSISVIFSDKNQIFLDKTYQNIRYSNFVDYKFSLPEVILFSLDETETVRLNLFLESYDYINQLLEVNVIGQVTESEIWVNPYYHFFHSYYHVVKNQTVIIEYKVLNNETNQTMIYTESIEIAEEDLDYTILY